MSPTNPELRQFITQFFSDEELETLCFDYFPEAANEFGGGMSKNRKVIILIGHCERRGRLADLRAALERERPAAWREAFAPRPVEMPRRDAAAPPVERDSRQIFLSHATADADFAQTLAADLRAEGWRVWIAPDSIRPAEKWVEAIDRGLETSGVFVVALTPDAVASRWVRTETNAAISMEHRDLIQFIPLDVAECQPPWLWTQYQFILFRGSYEAGLDALLRRLDGAPATPVNRERVQTSPPAPKPPPAEQNITTVQARQLQALAHNIADELGRKSGRDESRGVYRRFNQHFGLRGYKQLPRRRFDEGMAFLKSWRDEFGARSGSEPTQRPVPASNIQVKERESEPAKPKAEPDRRVHEKTGIELVRVPAGPFLYGSSDADKMAEVGEKPQRTIDLPEYWIGRYPVTNGQYKRFVDATGRKPPKHWTGNKPPANKLDHPVVNINWVDAQAFCDWAGLALPSEEEWEKAARGTDGRVWPWGNEPPTHKHCNFGANAGGTTPVGRYSPLGDSPYGCADMAGNVAEWTTTSAESGALRVVRGGQYYVPLNFVRVASSNHVPPKNRYLSVGCRVLGRPPS
jgi:formylglycine-generating enzyme required for sulfatase activity